MTFQKHNHFLPKFLINMMMYHFNLFLLLFICTKGFNKLQRLLGPYIANFLLFFILITLLYYIFIISLSKAQAQNYVNQGQTSRSSNTMPICKTYNCIGKLCQTR